VTTFVLVHGAWHGAWCWQPLVSELERRRARAIAVELPAEDVDAGCDEYARRVLEQAPATDDIVLIGHSLGGLTIPLVAVHRPVRALVFLCALLPAPGRSLVDQLRAEPDIFVPGFDATIARDAAGCSYWPDREAAIAGLYGDVDRAEAERAYARLRPQARLPSVEPCPLEAWPGVESIVIVAKDDHAIAPSWSRRAVRERLGAEALELPGDHSPFLSRPVALAELLLAATGSLTT
jgi:pimeloyl-ACP methyl ester carboxylesterase